ncbi:hypothetical protein LTR10_000609 [Elasticomyces elasticus]|nr:hypothetical protein LTR10_000609 [Elasticomyces elasticus]KAK4980142.1 hypothetical protein LTR42_000449 [Elasticomyces elasticus]
MAWQQYINRRNTIFFSGAVLVSSYLAAQYRQAEIRKANVGTYHVEPARSGMTLISRSMASGMLTKLQVVVYDD